MKCSLDRAYLIEINNIIKQKIVNDYLVKQIPIKDLIFKYNLKQKQLFKLLQLKEYYK